jgi:hypothetical protein
MWMMAESVAALVSGLGLDLPLGGVGLGKAPTALESDSEFKLEDSFAAKGTRNSVFPIRSFLRPDGIEWPGRPVGIFHMF